MFAKREFILAILDDEHGISQLAWNILEVIIRENPDLKDILTNIKSTEGRYYLPVDYSLQ